MLTTSILDQIDQIVESQARPVRPGATLRQDEKKQQFAAISANPPPTQQRKTDFKKPRRRQRLLGITTLNPAQKLHWSVFKLVGPGILMLENAPLISTLCLASSCRITDPDPDPDPPPSAHLRPPVDLTRRTLPPRFRFSNPLYRINNIIQKKVYIKGTQRL